MPRVFVTDDSIRPLVDRLVRAFVVEGNILALSRRLGEVLAESGVEGRLYPNRLVSLLSEDSTKAVNQQTVDTLRQALDLMEDDAGARAGIERITAKVTECWSRVSRAQTHDVTTNPIHAVADELQLPPAVVRVVLEEARVVDRSRRSGLKPSGRSRSRLPDWSFQDDAYRAVVDALHRDLNGKIGLVLPTGGGKTRTAIRIALRILADHPSEKSIVLWVTHRRFLRTQAVRELQRAMGSGTPDLPENAVALLASRVNIVLVSELERKLTEYSGEVALVVVDEAHRAAAPSYAPIFAVPTLRGLFLTATPNRTDQRAIGITSIAYTITYRELIRRGVLVEPRFEPPLVLPKGIWEDGHGFEDLCDYVLQQARSEFTKVIVVASRVDHVERIYEVMMAQLEREKDHVITPEEIGFVHGSASSSGTNPEAFLDEFTAYERGVLITTAQMLGEGFDDPKINAVVMTYPTTSMLQLMQVAGRGLRYAPGKERAYIVQAKESALAYHFEQRWLYQDISDTLRPQLRDFAFGSATELLQQAAQVLQQFNIDSPRAEQVLRSMETVPMGQDVSLLFTGMPYGGSREDFESKSSWHVVPVMVASRAEFLGIFNDFSEIVGFAKATDFLRHYIPQSTEAGSQWMQYRDMLNAMEYARRECTGEPYADAGSRPYEENRGTTWLWYVTFSYRPALPAALEEFLADAVNRNEIARDYKIGTAQWCACVKVDYPLGGSYALLLNAAQHAWVTAERQRLNELIRQFEPQGTFAQVGAWRAGCGATPVPQWLLERFEVFVAEDAFGQRNLLLQSTVH